MAGLQKISNIPILPPGTKRLWKSAWKSFKADFAEIEESLRTTKEEVREEIQLASEQAAHGFRRLHVIEFEENRVHRLQQATEFQENRTFRSQQMLAFQETRARQIQKLIKEEGNTLQLE